MNETPKSNRMLAAVRRRLYLARWARLFLLAVCWASVVAAVALPGAWLLDRVDLRLTLAAVPAAVAVALLVATAFARRPDRADAARAADEAAGTKDLFLTLTRLAESPQADGSYAPLVLRDAETAAARVNVRQAVPVPLERPLGWAASGLAVVLAAALLVPRFDPFGSAAAAQVIAKQQKELKALDKATQERKVELRKKNPEADLSEDIEQSVEQLKQALKQMKPGKKPENQKALSDRQTDLGQKWRKISAESLKDLFNNRSSDQEFGSAADGEELKKWAKELQEGSAESLRKEIDALKQDLQKLAKTTDPVERQETLRKVEERLKKMEKFAKETANSKPLAAALRRAQQQLDAARKAGLGKDGEKQQLSTEALESMKESLELSKMELQEIAQSARDLKELEKALQTAQMAKMANQNGELDGQECEDCVSMEDYQEFYKDLLAQMGLTEGDGLGGEGMGKGDIAPEDESSKTGFKTEKSKSAVTAGKVLLSMQTKGLSDTGEAEQNYAGQVQAIKQGVSEAILQEQVPPGYHEEIKKYFDALKPAEGAGEAEPASEPGEQPAESAAETKSG
jgi:hypothetical protein